MRRIVIIGLTSMMMGACSDLFIKEGMNKLVGQPLGAVIAKLGHPTEERVIARKFISGSRAPWTTAPN